MMRDVLYASDFVGKDVLDLESGDLIGVISGVLVEESSMKAVAFAYQVEEETGHHMAFCDFSQVTDIDQQVVVISSTQSYLPNGVRNVLEQPCLDADGQLLGRIFDCAWLNDSGMLQEFIVTTDVEQYGIAVSDIKKLGSGAVLLNVPASGIHKSAYQRAKSEANNEENAEEMMRHLIRRVGTTLSEAGQKVINRFTEKVGKEIRSVIDTISEQSKASKYATMESEIISVLRDLEGFTVSSPIYDTAGDVIIIPGYKIDENTVRRSIESNKIAELYRVAVSIKDGENNE